MWTLGSRSKRSSAIEVRSLAVEVDFLHLCKVNVCTIENVVKSRNLLNQRQCQDLSSKLSKTTLNIQELVLHYGTSVVLLRPALENLYRYLEKAKVLVSKCGEEDWCAAAVFQIQNENDFREILLDVSLCYSAIYEQVKSNTSQEWNVQQQDLRQSLMFEPATASDVLQDQADLRKKLEDLAKQQKSVKLFSYFKTGRGALKQSLARYLLLKLNYTSKQSQAAILDTCSAILWRKEIEPSGTWGNYKLIGAGSGSSGVCSTKWLGIPCAKKEFHPKEAEEPFLKEAGILAHLKHPCIVNFLCCGNGEEKGDRFIAMELMEKSLADLIKDQEGSYFSLVVAVDMMVQIARGMCYLHDQGVAHRDLKPQNVVVKRLTFTYLPDHFGVKLVDFEMSKTKVEVSKSNTISARGVGTTMYRAPEVHPKAHPDGKGKAVWFKADVYSFAMTCVHVLSLKVPFGDMRPSELYEEVKKGRRPELPTNCPQDLVALLRDCWDNNPGSRPSFVEVCTRLETFTHKIVRMNVHLVNAMDTRNIAWGNLAGSLMEYRLKEIVDMDTTTLFLKPHELEVACEDFSNIIGSSSDYIMYKGILSNGIEIAAMGMRSSVVDWSIQREKFFLCKVDALAKVKHPHLLNLVGYSSTEEPFTRFVVFEYTSNGTLYDCLHNNDREHLDWVARMRIVMGTAYGLAYMHHGLVPPLSHLNLGSNLIYLTENYAAKVVNAGMFKMFVRTDSKGNKWRLEDTNHHSLEFDSDIYNFGILLLEVITGCVPHCEVRGSLVGWANEYLSDQKMFWYMVDPCLKSYNHNQLVGLCAIVNRCLSSTNVRPSMQKITEMLAEVLELTPESVEPKLTAMLLLEPCHEKITSPDYMSSKLVASHHLT